MRRCGGEYAARIGLLSTTARRERTAVVMDAPLLPLALLAAAGLGGSLIVELILQRAVRRGVINPPRMYMQIAINAPLQRVWEIASDVQRQPEWMHEMKRVEML
ncbi:MAG: hypothetical protein ACO3BF_01185, partial [Candidatus Limnocylindrus sp.]